jgi:macrolide-specific efflux system membrane fusion protein
MKRKSPLNWKYPALAVCLLAAGGIIAWIVLSSSADQPDYEYLKVERGPLRVTLRESGVVQPEHRLTVTPPIPGRIDSIKVTNGAAVKQGQVLAWISSTARASLMDAARSTGGKEVAYWESIYKPAPLIAPLDGHIISTAVVPGQVVVTAQTVFSMSDHLIVQANVDETDLNHVWLGQSADITFDSFPNAHLTGKVHEIAFDATTVNNVTTYTVNIYLDSTPDYVRSGLSANVFLLISDRKDVLRIPTDAITPEDDILVAQGRDRPLALQRIEAGMSDGTWTEALSGVNEGDWIARRTFAIKEAEKKGFSFVSGMPNGKRPPQKNDRSR